MLKTLLSSTRTLVVLCLAAMCWAFSFGVGAPLASLWLKGAGCSATVIGLNTGVYYLGIALAACLVPWMMGRWGKDCMVAGMLASGATVACFPWGGSLLGWFVLRLLNGVAGAMSLIPLETLVNRNSPSQHRARNFGYYAFAVALGWSLGTLIGVQMYPLAPRVAFVLGGLVALLAAAIIWAGLVVPVVPEEQARDHTPLEFGRNLLSFGSAWSQGFLEGGMVGLLPVYLLAVGLSEAGVGWLMSGIMIGVILFQVPVAWLADRLGRTLILLACYVVTIGTSAALLCGLSMPVLAICLFFAGACSGAFYPLGLAILGEKVPGPALPRASAWYLGINCVGSLIGPVVAGVAMDLLGNHAIFAAGAAAVLFVVAVWVALRLHEFLRGGRGVARPVADTCEPGLSSSPITRAFCAARTSRH